MFRLTVIHKTSLPITSMKYKKHSWNSPSMGKKVSLTVFGTQGTPILAFPTDGGSLSDWEDLGLIDALAYQVQEGHNQIFCIESADNDSFFNTSLEPSKRISRYRLYEQFVTDEVIPFIRKEADNLFVIACGVHMGGYHALNLMLKHPALIQKVIAIGGRFQIRPFMGDYFDDLVYYNNPVEFLPNLDDQIMLEEIRGCDIRLVVTPDDPYLDLNYMLSDILRSKAIDHIFDYWMEPGSHPHDTWAAILQRHVP